MGRLTHLSLFSGIGGLDLAAEAAGFVTVGQCEWADYPTKILERHWPGAPRWRDIRTLTGGDFCARTGLRTVDVISGGFPCQPFSTAGKRRGREDDRYLWPEMLRVITEIKPTWVIGENVAGIINMALDTVLADLESQGYEARAFIFPACAVDAPHGRDRCAIVAHAYQPKRDRPLSDGNPAGRDGFTDSGGALAYAYSDRELQPPGEQPKGGDGAGHSGQALSNPHPIRCDLRGHQGQRIQRQDAARYEADSSGEAVSDPNDRGGSMRRDGQLSAAPGAGGGRCDLDRETPEHGSGEWWAAQSGMGRGHDGLPAWMDGVRAGWADRSWEAGIPRIAAGVPHRVDRLKALGNAVVPQQFYPVFREIGEIERRKQDE